MDFGKRKIIKALPLIGIGAATATGLSERARAQETSGRDGNTFDEILKRGTIRLGVVNTEPWYFKDVSATRDGPASVQANGVTWRGVGIFVAQRIAEALNVTLEPVETAWGTAVAGLQANQFDIMFALDGTPVRAKAIDFLSSQIAWSPFGMIVRPDAKMENWTDFNDPALTTAIVLGSAVDTFVSPILDKGTIERFQETSQAIAAFQAGRVDAVAGGLENSILASRIGNCKALNPKPLFAMPTGAGIRYDNDGRLKSYLSTAILYLYTSGQIQTAYEDFLKYRGVDPSTQTPIMRERIL